MSEQETLQGLKTKLEVIKDRVRGVATGFRTGFYLWGPGGTSKTHTVEETLKETGKKYLVTTNRLTARGLFDLLETHPAIVHVLDDVETLLSDRQAEGVLKGALDCPRDKERVVTWQTARDGREQV